jgi:hypothetical protein
MNLKSFGDLMFQPTSGADGLLALSNRIRLARYHFSDLFVNRRSPVNYILTSSGSAVLLTTFSISTLELIRGHFAHRLEVHSYKQLCLVDGFLLVRAIQGSSKAFAPDATFPFRKVAQCAELVHRPNPSTNHIGDCGLSISYHHGV